MYTYTLHIWYQPEYPQPTVATINFLPHFRIFFFSCYFCLFYFDDVVHFSYWPVYIIVKVQLKIWDNFPVGVFFFPCSSHITLSLFIDIIIIHARSNVICMSYEWVDSRHIYMFCHKVFHVLTGKRQRVTMQKIPRCPSLSVVAKILQCIANAPSVFQLFSSSMYILIQMHAMCMCVCAWNTYFQVLTFAFITRYFFFSPETKTNL